MSSFNDYVASSNNSINENKYNAKKARSPAHQFKQLIRPLIRLIKKSSRKNTYRKQPQPEYFIDECDQNSANELLEQRILQEIDCCSDCSAVPVYSSSGVMEILPVVREHRYIPVHFAKTQAGTFFWTSITNADSDINYEGDKNPICQNQTPEIQVPCDRWAQA